MPQSDGSLLVKLSEDPQHEACCGACGKPSARLHERTWRRIRERDWFDRRVWLCVPVRRLDCHHCGARVTERIRWLNRHARLTERLRAWVEALAELLPIAHIAKLTGLHWHTIKTIDKARLQRQFGHFEGRGVRRLVMDEFALHKGHRYATVVMDAQTMRVLWVGEGRSREAIRPFFERLGEEGCRHIEAVAMDMNTAFDLEVRQHCPQAAVKLDDLLAANAPLALVYLLKTALKEIWFAPSVQAGARQWRYKRLNTALLVASGLRFSSYDSHPWEVVPSALRGDKTAAGAYQIVYATWKEKFDQGLIVVPVGQPRFTPEIQDRIAVMKIEDRLALHLVRAGKVEDAVALQGMRNEWTSLPGGSQNAHRRTAAGGRMDTAYFRSLFDSYLTDEKRKVGMT